MKLKRAQVAPGSIEALVIRGSAGEAGSGTRARLLIPRELIEVVILDNLPSTSTERMRKLRERNSGAAEMASRRNQKYQPPARSQEQRIEDLLLELNGLLKQEASHNRGRKASA